MLATLASTRASVAARHVRRHHRRQGRPAQTHAHPPTLIDTKACHHRHWRKQGATCRHHWAITGKYVGKCGSVFMSIAIVVASVGLMKPHSSAVVGLRKAPSGGFAGTARRESGRAGAAGGTQVWPWRRLPRPQGAAPARRSARRITAQSRTNKTKRRKKKRERKEKKKKRNEQGCRTKHSRSIDTMAMEGQGAGGRPPADGGRAGAAGRGEFVAAQNARARSSFQHLSGILRNISQNESEGAAPGSPCSAWSSHTRGAYGPRSFVIMAGFP